TTRSRNADGGRGGAMRFPSIERQTLPRPGSIRGPRRVARFGRRDSRPLLGAGVDSDAEEVIVRASRCLLLALGCAPLPAAPSAWAQTNPPLKAEDAFNIE